MKRLAPIIILFLVILFLAGCAASGGAGGDSELDVVTSAYREHAGSSQDRVVFPGLRAWRDLARDDIVVRTRLNDYFLLTLEPACASDLAFDSSLQLAIRQQSRNTLSRFDTLRAGDTACRIQYIREVDHQAVAAALEDMDIDEPFIRLDRDR